MWSLFCFATSIFNVALATYIVPGRGCGTNTVITEVDKFYSGPLEPCMIIQDPERFNDEVLYHQTEWKLEDWSQCSKTCGGGVKTGARRCYRGNNVVTSAADCGGGEETVTFSCNEQPCPVDGEWTSWSPWTDCAPQCPAMSQTRSRSCSEPQHGGQHCSGQTDEIRGNGAWADWTPWAACSKTCALGSHSRTRTCTNPAPYNNGIDCDGLSTETEDCNPQPCPIHGMWADWTAWAPCPTGCATSLSEKRTRSCTNPAPDHGGDSCTGDAEEQKGHGAWSEWSVGSCSPTCGPGTQVKTRTCDSPAAFNGGDPCPGASSTVQACNDGECHFMTYSYLGHGPTCSSFSWKTQFCGPKACCWDTKTVGEADPVTSVRFKVTANLGYCRNFNIGGPALNATLDISSPTTVGCLTSIGYKASDITYEIAINHQGPGVYTFSGFTIK